MKKLLLTVLFASILFPSTPLLSADNDQPVEAWIEEKYEGGKRVEVIKVRLKSGKIVEVRPHLTKEKIPKPESKLSSGKERFLEYFGMAIMGLIVGSGVFLLIRKK
jgi:hypothetical protein